MEKLKIFNGTSFHIENSFNQWCSETKPIITRVVTSAGGATYTIEHCLYIFYQEPIESPK
jgi:hypothetical protein